MLHRLILMTLQENNEELMGQASFLLFNLLRAESPIEPDSWYFLSLITYKMRSIPPALLAQVNAEHPFRGILSTFQAKSNEMWATFSSSIMIFIQKGLPTILREKDFLGQPYIHLLMSNVHYSYLKLEDELAAKALCFLFALIENADPAADQIDTLIPVLTHLATDCFQQSLNDEVKCLCLQVLGMLVLYKPVKVLQFFNENKVVDFFLYNVGKHWSCIKNEEEVLRILLTFCTLLHQWKLLSEVSKEYFPYFTQAVFRIGISQCSNDEGVISYLLYEDYLCDYHHPFYDRNGLAEMHEVLVRLKEEHLDIFRQVTAMVTPEMQARFLEALEQSR